MGVVDITTLNNRQYCVILDPVDKDGKPQLGQKRLVKVLKFIKIFNIKLCLFRLLETSPESKESNVNNFQNRGLVKAQSTKIKVSLYAYIQNF